MLARSRLLPSRASGRLCVPCVVAAVLIGCSEEAVIIRVDPGVRYQTMVGWEATAQAGADAPGFATYRDSLLDLAVHQLGINRLRLEITSGAEQPTDWWLEGRAGRADAATVRCKRYPTINDNDDPAVIDWRGFQFAQLDRDVVNVVLPIKRRLEALGESLYLNLTYVSFLRPCDGDTSPYIHSDVAEYAEFALATFLHLRDQFGLVPDAWEMILEPDNTKWRGRAIGEALVATGDRLAAHGFHPAFIAPSTTDAANAVSYLDEMMRVPRVASYLRELSYHRYRNATAPTLRSIAVRARQLGLRTSMLEHIGSGYVDLHEDLTVANVSAWQQFALAFPTEDDGAQYYVVRGERVEQGRHTRFLRHYFRWVRAGAQRIGAEPGAGAVQPVAFINPDGTQVIVAQAAARARIGVIGLPAGQYGIRYTTDSESDAALPDAQVAAADTLWTAIPGRGVLTIFQNL
jgi:hypothetical protein